MEGGVYENEYNVRMETSKKEFQEEFLWSIYEKRINIIANIAMRKLAKEM